MNLDEAKEKIYNSTIVKYVSKERIEEAFKRIYVYDNEEDFFKAYGRPKESNDYLEGFNRANGSYIGPKATAHTIIHEVLHYISSEFDNDGHRTQNGLMGDAEYGNFANQVNEAVTDFLACKISGEKPRHYIEGNKIFECIDPIMQRFYNDEDILFKLYLYNNDFEFKRFLDLTLEKNGGAKDFYENFLFYSDDKINKMQKEMNKSVKKENSSIHKFVKKIKGFFLKKDMKYLNSGNLQPNMEEDSHKKFLKEYNVSGLDGNSYQRTGENTVRSYKREDRNDKTL